MNLQFIHDNRGNTTGVFIPIEEWQSLKQKYAELQKEEAITIAELSQWQSNIIDDYQNPTALNNFDKTLDDIEKTL